MPLSGYMQLPDIAGESIANGHEEEIDLHSISWKVAQKSAAKSARGRRSARSEVGAVRLNKFYDAASPYLALAAMQGRSFDEIVLSVRKDSGEEAFDYLKITLGNALITGYRMLPQDDDDYSLIEEEVSISAETINILYTVQADDHTAGAEHEVEYDIAAGV